MLQNVRWTILVDGRIWNNGCRTLTWKTIYLKLKVQPAVHSVRGPDSWTLMQECLNMLKFLNSRRYQCKNWVALVGKADASVQCSRPGPIWTISKSLPRHHGQGGTSMIGTCWLLQFTNIGGFSSHNRTISVVISTIVVKIVNFFTSQHHPLFTEQ